MATGRVPTTANSPLTAKGDLFGYSTTQARVPVGNDGETLVADSSATTGLRWQADWNTGKNKIINGDFYWNQRNFSSVTTSNTYGFDRWKIFTSTGCTYSPQTFTPGSAPVSGYEGKTFARLLTTGQSGASVLSILTQPIEDVRTLAGQTVTISFWSKAASGTPKIGIEIVQAFGTGGSSDVNTAVSAVTISTSWARYSTTVTIPSVSGKTITTSTDSSLSLLLWVSAGTDYASRASSIGVQNNTFDIWGVQVEAGSVATPFTTATGTLAGELAACQRYYYLHVSGNDLSVAVGTYTNGSTIAGFVYFPVSMRTAPTLDATSGTNYYRFERAGATDDFNSLTIWRPTQNMSAFYNNSEASGTGGDSGFIYTQNASARVAFTSEL